MYHPELHIKDKNIKKGTLNIDLKPRVLLSSVVKAEKFLFDNIVNDRAINPENLDGLHQRISKSLTFLNGLERFGHNDNLFFREAVALDTLRDNIEKKYLEYCSSLEILNIDMDCFSTKHINMLDCRRFELNILNPKANIKIFPDLNENYFIRIRKFGQEDNNYCQFVQSLPQIRGASLIRKEYKNPQKMMDTVLTAPIKDHHDLKNKISKIKSLIEK